MRIGLALPQMGPSAGPDRIAEFASKAEELGYDTLWASDRILTPLHPDPIYPGCTPEQPWPPEQARFADPIITLSVAAASTSRVHLNTSTFNATWYPPLALARSFTTLDLLSRGRLELGFGVGWMRTEYQALDIPFAKRHARLEEAIAVLRTMWTTNPVEHDGQLWHIPPSQVDLRPYQPGGPPIFLGGFGPRALERIGRLADGWLPAMSVTDGLPVEAFDQLWQTARKAAVSAGRDPDTLRRELRINPSPETPVEEAVQVASVAREAGYDGAFIELAYTATSLDHALDLAASAMELYQRG